MLILVSPTLTLRSETSNFPHIRSLVTGYVLVCFVIYWRKSVDCVMVEIFSYWVFLVLSLKWSCQVVSIWDSLAAIWILDMQMCCSGFWFLELFCSPHSLALVGLFRTTFWWSTTVHCPQIPSSKYGKTSSWRFLRFYKNKFFLYRKII